MLDLKTYPALRAYITNYVKGDARISAEGFLWGESKRTIDKALSKPIYPFFWVTEVEWLGTSHDGHSNIQFNWSLHIEIAGNATRGLTDKEENQVGDSHEIMMDFIRFLIEEHRNSRIKFDFPRLNARQTQVGEGENVWGWSFVVYIAVHAKNFCLADEETRHYVSTWRPDFVDEETQISITIDGTEYFYTWAEIDQQAHMLIGIVNQINQDSNADVTAYTDEQYLYIRSKAINDPPVITLTPGQHEFTQMFQ